MLFAEVRAYRGHRESPHQRRSTKLCGDECKTSLACVTLPQRHQLNSTMRKAMLPAAVAVNLAGSVE